MSQIGRISGPLLEANLLRRNVVEPSNEYLAFHNNSITDNLIYLDVVQSKIGIRDGSPSDELRIRDDFKTNNLIVETLLTVGEIEIRNNNSITSLFQPIEFVASSYIFSENIRTNSINIDDNVISTITSNSDIELRPNGSGSLEIHSDFNITGNLSATGDLTLGGDITFGNANTDSVIIAAEVAGDIIPDQTGVFSLGVSGKRWNEVHPILYNGTQITVGGISIGAGVNPALRPGKIWFVAQNGANTNQGNHENSPFATIKHALGQATADDTIFIYPGIYDEDLPLIVPTGVSVTGANIRTVVIRPDTDTQSNDVFLLNGETTVSNLTVKDFYYDSINNTGYAFRFASGFKVTSRSPYVQNITVLTRGSSTSISDPRGFDSGDAGKGALVDGSVADPATKEASMLFHSVTFITPGVDALTMTNGVRVEWLNSFSYFANRGMYATAGVGRVSQDGSTLRFGAEVRSIGSANVYGNYGAWAEGQDTLMYLINHNFAYIGTQGDENNDGSARIQANETVELDTGRIYYQSLDQEGDFRVGDVFNIDAQTGQISIDGISTSASGITAINFADGVSETTIDASEVSTGNIRFRSNILSSLSGPINITAATGIINVTENVFVAQNLNVTGNTHVAGQVTIGNQPIDIVDINADIEFDLRPNIDNFYELGSELKQWRTVFINSVARIDNALEIATTKIETIASNSDLELLASGTGRIYVPSNNVDIDNITVNTVSNFANVSITGAKEHTGNVVQTGNTLQTGIITLTGNTTITEDVEFQDIAFIDNRVTTLLSNSDLELVATGLGQINIVNTNVEIDQQLRVTQAIISNTVNAQNTVTADQFIVDNILIDDNYITSTQGNDDLELLASGVGRIYIPNNNVEVNQNLTVNTDTILSNLNVTGEVTQQGNIIQTGNIVQTGNIAVTQTLTVNSQAYFNEIAVIENTVTTTSSNADLELYAAGTGVVYVPADPVKIDNTLTVSGAVYTSNINNSILITSNVFTNNVVEIDNNLITTSTLNTDLILEAAGTGLIEIPNNSVTVSQNLTVGDITNLSTTNITGSLVHVGNLDQTGTTTHTGNFEISNNLTVSNDLYFDDISIVNNVISTTLSNSNLELQAAGIGNIYVPSDSVRIDNDLTVLDTVYTSNINNGTLITSNIFTNNVINIDDNLITTSTLNTNLILEAAGSGLVEIPNNSVIISQNLTVDNVSTLANTNITGTRVHIGNLDQTGTTTHTGNFEISNNLTVSNDLYFDDISIVNNVISTTLSNSNLELQAAQNGFIKIPLDNVRADLAVTITGSTSTSNITNSGTITSEIFLTNDVEILDNYLTSRSGTTNLRLEGNNAGGVILEKIRFNNNVISTESNNDNIIITPGTAKSLLLDSVTALKIPAGTTANRSTNLLGDLRFATDDNLFSGWSTARRTFGGIFSANRQTFARAHPTNNTINFTINGVSSLEVLTDRIRINGLLINNQTSVKNNIILNTVPDADLILASNGTGTVALNNISVESNEIGNRSNTDKLIFQSSADGYLKLVGTAIVIPFGGDSLRPAVPELGDLRFNTDSEITEIYNGTQYTSITGTGDIATEDDIREFGDLWSLILG